jgi:hypothetical protein
MVGRAAYRTNRVRGDLLLVDELSDRLEEAGRESEGRTGDVDPRRDLGH